MICLCFGSIHAYGVLLAPIEQWLDTSRTVASLGYAVAIAALTLGVYLNGRIEAVIGPRLRLIGSGVVAAVGLVLAGGNVSPTGLITGFGLMYGLANGIAYAMSLGIAAAAMPGREAQAMGLATATYGLVAARFCSHCPLRERRHGRIPEFFRRRRDQQNRDSYLQRCSSALRLHYPFKTIQTVKMNRIKKLLLRQYVCRPYYLPNSPQSCRLWRLCI